MLLKVEGGHGGSVVEVGHDRAETLRMGVGNGGEGEDEGHQDGGPGEFVLGGNGEVSHRNWSKCK